MLVRYNQTDLEVINELHDLIEGREVKKLGQLVVDNFTNRGNPKRESYLKIYTAVCYLEYGPESFTLSIRHTTKTRGIVRLTSPKEAQVPLVFAPDERTIFASTLNWIIPPETDDEVRKLCYCVLKGIRITGNEFDGYLDLIREIISKCQIRWVGKKP